jgi:hypothetical protein
MEKLTGEDYLTTPLMILMSHPDYSEKAMKVMLRIKTMTSSDIERINLIGGMN